MSGSLPLLASIATVAAFVIALVDGRRAVAIAIIAAVVGLAPTAAYVVGETGAVELLGVGLVAVVGGAVARRAASALPWVAGLDPLVPMYAPDDTLFGPRSARTAGAVLLLPAASWVSFNIPVGSETSVSGLVFPAAYIGLCAALRLISARTVEDLAVGHAALAAALMCAWLIRSGTSGEAAALAAAPVVVGAAIVAGWMSGRHRRREAVAT